MNLGYSPFHCPLGIYKNLCNYGHTRLSLSVCSTLNFYKIFYSNLLEMKGNVGYNSCPFHFMYYLGK